MAKNDESDAPVLTDSGDFDPASFLVVPARTFDDLEVGEVFGRTSTARHSPGPPGMTTRQAGTRSPPARAISVPNGHRPVQFGRIRP
jgi:hypothetical protein